MSLRTHSATAAVPVPTCYTEPGESIFFYIHQRLYKVTPEAALRLASVLDLGLSGVEVPILTWEVHAVSTVRGGPHNVEYVASATALNRRRPFDAAMRMPRSFVPTRLHAVEALWGFRVIGPLQITVDRLTPTVRAFQLRGGCWCDGNHTEFNADWTVYFTRYAEFGCRLAPRAPGAVLQPTLVSVT